MSRNSATRDDVVTFMYVPDQTAAIRRFHVRRRTIRNVLVGLSVVASGFLVMSVDYVRARIELRELDSLRSETTEQRSEIQDYAHRVEFINGSLAKINGLERKLRVITNLDPADRLPLPGIGGTDGELLGIEDLAWLSRAKRHQRLNQSFESLSEAAGVQEESLNNLILHLEDQTARLVHTPSLSPTQGWIT